MKKMMIKTPRIARMRVQIMWKNIFLSFCSKHRLLVHVRTDSTSTHNLCFGEKIRKNRYTPASPSFTIQKWGIRRKCYPHVVLERQLGFHSNMKLKLLHKIIASSYIYSSFTRVLTRILKIGVKMRYFLKCWILPILYYLAFSKSWRQNKKVGGLKLQYKS